MAKKLDITKQRLTRLVKQGMTVREIQAVLGCSSSTVRRRMGEWDLELLTEPQVYHTAEPGDDTPAPEKLGSTDMTEDRKTTLIPPTSAPTSAKIFFGKGLDIGTMNIVSAVQSEEGVVTSRTRDAFLDLDLDAKAKLQLGGTTFVEYEDHILILGDDALQLANLFKREARRPLAQGLISASEHDALEVLSIMIEGVLGKPQVEDEVCYYSIPASPVDAPERDVVYHEAAFERILEELGYTAISGNEAMAIIYAECAKETFSGIGISFGSGMVNIALSYQTLPIMEFSLARGGDWIDAQSAQALGTTASRMCTIKEKGINLAAPVGREQEALVVYYKSLINYALKHIAKQFKAEQSDTELTAIPIVVSGGTSLPDGFIEVFESVFDKKHRKRFPLEISEVRRASNPMTAVAEGLLVQARQDS